MLRLQHVFFVSFRTRTRTFFLKLLKCSLSEQRRRFLGAGLKQSWEIHRIFICQEWRVSKLVETLPPFFYGCSFGVSHV